MLAISIQLAAAGMMSHTTLYSVSREGMKKFLKAWEEADRWKITEKMKQLNIHCHACFQAYPSLTAYLQQWVWESECLKG